MVGRRCETAAGEAVTGGKSSLLANHGGWQVVVAGEVTPAEEVTAAREVALAAEEGAPAGGPLVGEGRRAGYNSPRRRSSPHRVKALVRGEGRGGRGPDPAAPATRLARRRWLGWRLAATGCGHGRESTGWKTGEQKFR